MSSSSQYMQNSSTKNSTVVRLGDIEHLAQLSENLSSLCLSHEYADITLVVEGQKLYAHKVILAARSEYFRALLYGGLKESNQSEIVLPDAPVKAFKILLKYIYSGHMFLMTLKEDVILDTLGLAHQYGFQDLETAISDILKQLLALRNVCAILDTAHLYGLEKLVDVCHAFLDRHASEILLHESFLQLSQASLVELLQRDSFFAPEVEIFRGVCTWCTANDDKDDRVMKCVRLPLMSVADLLSVVRPAGLVKPDALLDAIAERTNVRLSSLPHRGQLILEENVASPRMGSKVVAGELLEYLLDGDYYTYDMEKGYTRHPINGPGDQGIIIKLGMPSIINHIRMLLWDRDLRSYSYYIEVSMEQKDWVRVVDYSHYCCRSWQYLYFENRVVQFIRIVGTHNTVNKVFHLVSFEASCKLSIPKMVNDIICPNYNVATLDKSAVVIEGVSRSRNALLNGDTKHYDWDSGYTCHQLGSGAILIQLGQPYVISSLRLLLWDCDDRTYSYYIESSVNVWDWEMVVDHTRENCKSWQLIRFPPRPVVFIRIVGTHNSANEVFHCVHFECPSCEDQGSSGSAKPSTSKSITSEKDVSMQTAEIATEAEEMHSEDDDKI
ncbi:BTB/POZ domain-containing protein 9 [Tribolium madens]|uniref:BTB/POZ domain-containing protein 9 n=1 Tax=Tribolium madens TaxID=41895 RepID=UPI001CF7675C|nr:BTB/POZ domain-containing protein 9 [Tribolium madens]XP_044263424.1 BTB/POZ domain-containing protein 9 [Tribolium madens]XP_044263425.1 BTB/POZ domain-containing protein 9 [Tribolium madens]